MNRKRASKAAAGAPGALPLDHLEARPFLLKTARETLIHMVGCGGTGSWLAPSIARLGRLLAERGQKVRIVFSDHDRLEPVNIPRQNFCDAEIGQNKARALAARYSAAWGIAIEARERLFKAGEDQHELRVLVGCVDNAAARRAISEDLRDRLYGTRSAPNAVWIDCGNMRDAGQVLFGTTGRAEDLAGAFELGGACTRLPSPSLQAPDLLVPRPEEASPERLSCAELAARGVQSLVVNQMVASVATDYLMRLLLTRNLTRFQTYFDLKSGSMRSTYITPDSVARASGVERSALEKAA